MLDEPGISSHSSSTLTVEWRYGQPFEIPGVLAEEIERILEQVESIETELIGFD